MYIQKYDNHQPLGKLQLLQEPRRPWGSLTMDFITDLPLSGSTDSILVVVDRLTKSSVSSLAQRKSTPMKQQAY